MRDAHRATERADAGRRPWYLFSMGRIHDACYEGDPELVSRLLAAGADPNERSADPRWVSCASGLGGPTPLSCAAIAWSLAPRHVEVMRLLLDHGAVVEEAVLADLSVEAVGSATDNAAWELLLGHAAPDLARRFAGPPPWGPGFPTPGE